MTFLSDIYILTLFESLVNFSDAFFYTITLEKSRFHQFVPGPLLSPSRLVIEKNSSEGDASLYPFVCYSFTLPVKGSENVENKVSKSDTFASST